MAITFPISLPSSPGIRSVRITPNSIVGASRSPFTAEVQTYEHQGQWLDAEIEYPPMRHATARPLIAALTSLKGRAGTFLLGDPDGATARGAAASTPGTPVVKGGGQVQTQTLEIDGAPVSTTGYLLVGDYIQLGSGSSARLHMVLEDADSDGSGNVSLTLWPKITTAPADNAPVVVADTVGVFRLKANSITWDSDQARIYRISMAAESVV